MRPTSATLCDYVNATSLASLDATRKSGLCRLVYRGGECYVVFGN